MAIRRHLSPFAATCAGFAAAALALAPQAQARVVEPGPSVSGSIPAGELCAFPIDFTATGKSGTITLPGGSSRSIFPNSVNVLVNHDTGTSVRFVTTGALTVTPRSEGTVDAVLTGTNLFSDPDGFWYLEGRFTTVLPADGGGATTPILGTGRKSDVCGLLA